ncbi:MAG: zinc metallopeptidase [Granulosicoccus sp.]|nr:zinc metallopeptidase [Granulosicoccus sp.]
MIIIFGILLFGSSWVVRWWMNRTYARWKAVPNSAGATGEQVARHILSSNNLHHVQMEVSPGQLSDHYVPAQKLLRLSESINNEKSVASAAVAAHECGHALQDAQHYGPLTWKARMMPAAVAGNNMGMLLAVGGGMLGSSTLVDFGMLLFALGILMPVLTLPIEFDASKRALAQLQALNLVDEKDYDGAKSMLTAAALTYVAGAATSMIFLVIIMARFMGRR